MESQATRVRARAGIVAAYVGRCSLAELRALRAEVGRVTVSGRSGMDLLHDLDRDDDLFGVDFDPKCYLAPPFDGSALFAEDWVAEQRRLHLPLVRSTGTFVSKGDDVWLKKIMNQRLPTDVTRVVSLEQSWLLRPALDALLAGIRISVGPLALVFAGPMDPFERVGAVDALPEIVAAADPQQRRVELLRTDLTGIAFAALGGALGAIGAGRSTRHHGLPLSKSMLEAMRQRQRRPLVLVPELASWQYGTALGALTEFGGAGLTDCDCIPCAGRSLLRFDRTYPSAVPADVAADARAHDVATWTALAGRVLRADDPLETWREVCSGAVRAATRVLVDHKVKITIPRSISAWVK